MVVFLWESIQIKKWNQLPGNRLVSDLEQQAAINVCDWLEINIEGRTYFQKNVTFSFKTIFTNSYNCSVQNAVREALQMTWLWIDNYVHNSGSYEVNNRVVYF